MNDKQSMQLFASNNYYYKKLSEIYNESYQYATDYDLMNKRIEDAAYLLLKLTNRTYKSNNGKKLEQIGIDQEVIDSLKKITNNSISLNKESDKLSDIVEVAKNICRDYFDENYLYNRYDAITTLNSNLYNLPIKKIQDLQKSNNQAIKVILEKKISNKLTEKNLPIDGLFAEKIKTCVDKIELYYVISNNYLNQFIENFIYPAIELSEEYNIHSRYAILSNLNLPLSLEEQIKRTK